MLLTERQLSRRRNLVFPQPKRIIKVRKSMGAIKHVLGERKRVCVWKKKERFGRVKMFLIVGVVMSNPPFNCISLHKAHLARLKHAREQEELAALQEEENDDDGSMEIDDTSDETTKGAGGKQEQSQ